jgi:hypothetical protein
MNQSSHLNKLKELNRLSEPNELKKPNKLKQLNKLFLVIASPDAVGTWQSPGLKPGYDVVRPFKIVQSCQCSGSRGMGDMRTWQKPVESI